MKNFDVRCPECSYFLCRVDPEVLEMTVRCSCCGKKMTVRKLCTRHYTVGREGDPGAVLVRPMTMRKIRTAEARVV